MFPTVEQHRLSVLLPAAALALLLSAGQACAQARLQTMQSGRCQHNGGRGQPNSRQQLNALRTSLQNNMRRLNALEQTGQLTSVQLQAMNQLQSDLQNAMQQLTALQKAHPGTPWAKLAERDLAMLPGLAWESAVVKPPPKANPLPGRP